MLLLVLLLALPLAGSLQEAPGYWLQVQELVTVEEGLCALVSCSFSYPGTGWNYSTSAYGYWYRKRNNSNINPKKDQLVATNDPGKNVKIESKSPFHLLGDPRDNNCSLSISEAQKRNSGRYYFRLERGPEKYSYQRPLLIVNVTALTQTPAIHIPEPLESGRLGRLTCTMPGVCKGPMAPKFSWAGAAPRPLELGSEVLLAPRPQDHGSRLTCLVTFPKTGVILEKTIWLNVSYAPQNVTISVSGAGGKALELQGNDPHLDAQEGQSLRLLCTADGQPPTMLSWLLEDRVLTRSPPKGSRTLGLELPGVKAGDSGHYTCQAENGLGSQRRTLDLSVQYPPEELRVTVSQVNRTVTEILGNGTYLPVLEGQSLQLACATHSNPPAQLSWVQGTRTLSPARPSAPWLLELPRVQTEHEGEFTCLAQSPLGARHLSLSLSVHYPPKILGPACSWGSKGLHCSCSCRARPAPSLHWRLGEGMLGRNSSNASVTVTVTSSSAGPWANSSLDLRGGLSSGLRLSCEAQNVHGAQSATVLLLPGRPECEGSALLPAVGGAGVALLCLCACLGFLMMKIRRKEAARLAAAGPDAPSAQNPDSGGALYSSCSAGPAQRPPPAAATPTPGAELELHYASLSFRARAPRPREPQDQGATSTTEYAEIKIRGDPCQPFSM